MFIKQGEIFWGLGHDFVKTVMETVTKESYDSGQYIFSEGEPALHFYILISGRVKLTVGEAGRSVFIVSHAGELFGWSSLVDREAYSASALCKEPTSVSKIDREAFWKLCTHYPEDGLVFMKRIARFLGQRLLKSYELIDWVRPSDEYDSYGTGQVIEAAAEE
jgi:CRP-like cAMP-binding protein